MSGSEQSLISLIEGLNRSKFNPFIILPENGLLEKRVRELGVETILLPSMIKLGEGYRLWKALRISRSVYRIAKLIREKRIQIVHSNSLRACFLVGLAAKITRVPSVAHVRDIHFSPFSSSAKSSLLNKLCDVFIAVSYSTRDFILKQCPNLQTKIKVIYNGIDLRKLDGLKKVDIRSELKIEKDAPLISNIGIINPVKGHDIVIRAAAMIRKNNPNLRVLIVGGHLTEKDKLYEIQLRQLTRELDLDNNVIFTGFRNDIYNLIQSTDVVVLASRYQDPLPRTLIEASALRKPIVATRVGGIPEIVENGVSGILVEPNDSQALAKSVIFLLENRERAKEMSQAARRIAETKFRIEDHVKKIIGLYAELTTEKR